MKKTIILPTYNEKNNITKLIQAIYALGIADLNIIVVDDNSPDGTGLIADKLSLNLPIEVIHRQNKLGLGSAYITGFKKALANGADLIFEMDSDFSHNPKDLPQLIEQAVSGYEVVIGSRRIKGGDVHGWSWWRNLQSKAAMTFARTILGLKTYDITAGFRCYQRRVLEIIDLDKIKSNGYAFQEEMLYLCEKNNFKIKEIPVTFVDRQQGKSKLGLKDVWEFFITIIRLKFKL